MNNQLLKLFGKKRIAVVGSANSLQEFGTIIDGFDVVVRFNLAYPQFPKKLGTRTDVLVCNIHVAQNLLRNKNVNYYVGRKILTKEYAQDYMKHVIQSNPWKICRNDTVKTNPSQKIIHITHSKSLHFCNSVLSKLGISEKLAKEPRMGFHITCLLISMGIVPTLFYFDIDKPNNDKFFCTTLKSSCHNFDQEGKILSILRSRKLLTVYQTPQISL